MSENFEKSFDTTPGKLVQIQEEEQPVEAQSPSGMATTNVPATPALPDASIESSSSRLARVSQEKKIQPVAGTPKVSTPVTPVPPTEPMPVRLGKIQKEKRIQSLANTPTVNVPVTPVPSTRLMPPRPKPQPVTVKKEVKEAPVAADGEAANTPTIPLPPDEAPDPTLAKPAREEMEEAPVATDGEIANMPTTLLPLDEAPDPTLAKPAREEAQDRGPMSVPVTPVLPEAFDNPTLATLATIHKANGTLSATDMETLNMPVTPIPFGDPGDPTPGKLARIEKERSALFADLETVVVPATSVSPQSSQIAHSPKTETAIPLKGDPQFQLQVQHYMDWLSKQAEYDRQRDRAREIEDYLQEATKPVTVGKTKVAIFAPFRAKLSALQTFTNTQFIGLCTLGLLWLGGLYVFQLRMLTGTLAAVTVLYTFSLLLNLVLAVRSSRQSPEEQISDEIVHALKDVEWPMYTILCPLYKEAEVVPQFVRSMQSLDYPEDKLQILFLTEENDAATRNAIRALNLPPHFKILVVPDGQPRTKPRACNYGLLYTEGSYVVIYDAEDAPDPLQLKKAILTFANHGVNVACVQAKLNFYNIRQNILTRWFTAEYSTWFDMVLPGLQLARFSLPLGGTSNHFRVDILRALGAWDAYNVTEDCDLGLRLKRYKMETVILDSTTLEEANPNLKNWIRQRSRWIKGYMQTYLVHMRHPLEYFSKGRLYELFSFQVVVGSGTGVLLINPFVWVLLILYIAFGSKVIDVYHILFPGPVLYLSAFCLIFGNFFYLYLYLLACVKRKLYYLLPWTLLIPIYWFFMSVAAFFAFWELIVRPHYWQKTVHGLHMKKKPSAAQNPATALSAPAVEEPKVLVAAVPAQDTSTPSSTIKKATNPVLSVTSSLRAMPTQLMPAISLKQKQAQTVAQRAKVRDLWQIATVTIACLTSIIACWYYFQQHDITLYADALSHMRISRGVFDSLTPGLAQLGSVWLPLPHILMWPFIWNNYLWQTGLAGSLVGMPCYILASLFIFRAARRITRNSGAAFIGTLVFIFNPNVLYLQSTPLSETVCMAALTMSVYYFLCWISEGTTKLLVITAISAFLATLARYDGWPLFVAIAVCIPIIGLMKHHRFFQIISNIIVFCLLGGLGIILWLVWNQLIFGDPLYFQRGAYSSKAQQLQQLQVNHLYSYHNLWESIRYYSINTSQSVGIILCVLAIVGLIWFLVTRRFKPETIGVLVYLVPFAFYILALYTAQAIIWLPGAVPAGSHLPLYNVRYGAQMVAPVAVLFAILASKIRIPSRFALTILARASLIGVILLQSFLTFSQGVISLEEGQYNYSCIAHFQVAQYLSQHYQGGLILEDIVTTQGETDPTLLGIDFKNIIYEGSGTMWYQALQYPASVVDWVIVNPTNGQDLVAQHINVHSTEFSDEFIDVSQQPDGIHLFHRVGRPLASHPGLTIWNVPHNACS